LRRWASSPPISQRAVLIAGSLGVSSLVCLLNGDNGQTETTANLLGLLENEFPRTANGESIIRSAVSGDNLRQHGSETGTDSR
jgi:catechol 1,2-dioxygenase